MTWEPVQVMSNSISKVSVRDQTGHFILNAYDLPSVRTLSTFWWLMWQISKDLPSVCSQGRLSHQNIKLSLKKIKTCWLFSWNIICKQPGFEPNSERSQALNSCFHQTGLIFRRVAGTWQNPLEFHRECDLCIVLNTQAWGLTGWPKPTYFVDFL